MPVDPSASRDDPHSAYTQRLEVQRRVQWKQERDRKWLASANWAVAALAVVIVVVALGTRAISILWVLVPGIAFVFLVIFHGRGTRSLRKTLRVIAFYEGGLARLKNCWMGKGESGERFLDVSHPYARDLDLFGKGSLFELLCTARTPAGETTLANWLLNPAPPEEIQARQAAISELRSCLKFREDLAVLGEDVRSGVRPEVLAAWAESKLLFESRPMRIVLAALAALWLFSLIVWGVWGLAYPTLIITLINLCITYRFHARLHKVVPPAEEAARDLGVLAEVLSRLEKEKFSAPKLSELQAALIKENVPPSLSIARLRRLVEHLESRRNLFLATVDPFIFWTLQWTFAIEAWRKKFGPAMRRWLAAVGELEALSALAGYAYEHPADIFPEFTEAAPCFEAEGLAHPFIPESQAARNDLSLNRELRLVIISGPNMAGKSTFIRAVGINAVLAQCGAPVRARRLRLSRLAVTASICVLDSLQGGISRFYAEITRLKQITNQSEGPFPVLFLLDELLQGTNSHDRRLGAEAILESLLQRGAVGLVTTHDLALTQIAASMQELSRNFHFDDRLEDGKLCFDYQLKPGIAESTNALELMRSIGLVV